MSNQPIDEKAVFNSARRLAGQEERVAYLQQVCGHDPEAMHRVLELLRIYDQENSFLESPPVALGATVDIPPLNEKPGTVIGPYKLLQQIGEGGMGTVFMAEQTEPIQRKVALKVIKAGMDSRQVIARFEAERQALAMMDHVNIARVFDGGTTGESSRHTPCAVAARTSSRATVNSPSVATAHGVCLLLPRRTLTARSPVARRGGTDRGRRRGSAARERR